MNPGERCDEILRLIDETLEDYAANGGSEAHSVDGPRLSSLRPVAPARTHLPRSA